MMSKTGALLLTFMILVLFSMAAADALGERFEDHEQKIREQDAGVGLLSLMGRAVIECSKCDTDCKTQKGCIPVAKTTNNPTYCIC
uniref:Teretoxin Tan9.6 n=1 Tax=Terebra anilis TaxID=553697 RepID=T96_TERAN|nr:RecName: Full=Teretoxin Tan9.6; Flags: Precursor [Terebra anilis]